ncbi:ribosome biogenesis protein NOP53 [Salvia hispanica]|uniref:ribosome biogenesis protein NOP53 n=1 Tax=Salvia hispanica TaxID=49212 RepID=UPI0020092192|nr:ribosome biogenesis protein NOP53 [Salvia hispanica]
MGKRPKSSRKGKKEWRANISTEDIEDFYDKTTKDALSGGSLADVPSDSLFFLDKSRDLSVKRKIEKNREKVLRCDSVLQRNPFIKAIPSSTQNKQKSKRKGKAVSTPVDEDAAQGNVKDESAHVSGVLDLWEEKEGVKAKIKKKPKTCIIPAVEVEHPGCSFNPHPESHQDALARAVADEMQKMYQHELGPQPIPLVVPGEAIDEEYKYFLEADADGTDDDENENQADGGDEDAEKSSQKTKRVTRVEFNRRARRKERLRIEAEDKKVKGLSKEIDSLPEIMEEIAKEDEEKHNRHLRRIVAKQERLKARPSRLGKYKFEPSPLQVLLTEEKTGSLRQLKGCCTLVRDRYKSLEKRGLIIPTKKGSRR